MSARRPRRRDRFIVPLLVSVCGLMLGATIMTGGYVGRLLLTGNFHTVVSGQLYRSGQPSAGQLFDYARVYGIRTIVNLRGENSGAPWYDAEVQEARNLDIDHVDFRMSARRRLSQDQAAELIHILATAKRPILVHCTNGADRSGLAAALYVAAVGKLGEDEAEKQISIRFGHISLSLNGGYAMDETFESLEPWLGFPNS